MQLKRLARLSPGGSSNNGQKWQTDAALRTGMAQIRAAVDTALPLIYEGRFTAAEFSTLADKVEEQVDSVVANCKLPEEADLQLHLALTQVLDGINAMRGAPARRKAPSPLCRP